jgi:hypothetical protein
MKGTANFSVERIPKGRGSEAVAAGGASQTEVP